MNSWRAEFGDAFAGRRVLVTGGTGFIGRHLSDALRALDAEVHVFSRKPGSHQAADPSNTWTVDLFDLEAVRSATLTIRPQIVYHLAGLVTSGPDPDLVLPTLWADLLGTVHVLIAAMDVSCQRVVVAGSSEEPMHVFRGPGPSSPYAAAKAASSLYTRMFNSAFGLPTVIGRTFVTYGPGQDATRLVPYAISRLLQGEYPSLRAPERVCDFIFVLDVVRGFLKMGAASGLEGTAVDLGTGKGTKVRKVVELLVEIIGCENRPPATSSQERPEEPGGNATLAVRRNAMGWRPKWSLREGLMATVKWYRDLAR